MKTGSRFLALLLCLCLIGTVLAGCSTPAPDSPAGAPAVREPTPQLTPPQPDAAELYAGGANRLREAELLCADYSIVQEISLPDYTAEEPGPLMTLTETTERHAQYQGLGSDSLVAVVKDELTMGRDTKTTQLLTYADGIEYVDLKGALYCSEVRQADFLAGQLPLLLLDASLYGSLTAEEAEGGYALRFDAPAAAEAWALPQEAELLEAAGTALVSPDGALTEAAYSLRYRFGGLTVSTRYEGRFQIPEALDLTGSVPQSVKPYESLDDPTAPLTVMRARTILRHAKVCSAVFNGNFYTQAAGYSVRYYDTLNAIDRVSDMLIHEENNISAVDYSSMQSYSYKYEMRLENGKMTMEYDDGETEETSMYTAEARKNVSSFLTDYFPFSTDLKDAEGKDVGAYRLISFSGGDDYGLRVKDLVCESLFSAEPTILDDHAESYLTKSLTGFLAVEQVSGIPTALNLSYAGIHTIEGQPCSLDMELNLALSLYTNDAAKGILDEPLDGPEPEQKPTPVFYRVDDEEGNTLFLLGTIHIGDDRTACLPQVIYDAFDAADALAVEFDDENFEESLDQDEELRELLLQSFYYTDGTTIRNHVDSDVYKAAMDLVKVTGNYTDTAENMKPYLWGNAIEQFYLAQGRKLSSDKGVDVRLMRMAREAEKEILDVESGQFQVSMLGGYTDPVQEMLLAEMTEIPRSEFLSGSYELYEAWCLGDEAALIERLAAMSEEERAELDEDELAIYDEYHQKMEVERNANMVEKAREFLQSGKTVFCAVGLAHLLGEGGMVEALRAAGYTVTLIDTH